MNYKARARMWVQPRGPRHGLNPAFGDAPTLRLLPPLDWRTIDFCVPKMRDDWTKRGVPRVGRWLDRLDVRLSRKEDPDHRVARFQRYVSNSIEKTGDQS